MRGGNWKVRAGRASSTTFLALGLLCGGCDEEPERPSPEDPHDLPRPERGSADDTPFVASPYPEEMPALQQSLGAFVDTERCVTAFRERVPTEVTDVVTDLGYEQLLSDTCGGLAAVRDGDEAACDALSVSSVRRGCRLRLAVVHGRPDACPEATSGGGRDASCLAWATRDPSLCRAASTPDATLCTAAFANDPELCAPLTATLRLRCEARVRRLAGSIVGDREESVAEIDPSFRIELTPEGATPTTIDIGGVSRGVYLRAVGCEYAVSLGDEVRPSISLPSATLDVRVAPGSTPAELLFGPTGAVLTVQAEGLGRTTSISGSTGGVTVREFEARRGGRLVLSLDGSLTFAPRVVPVHGEAVTFVRDLDTLDEACP